MGTEIFLVLDKQEAAGAQLSQMAQTSLVLICLLVGNSQAQARRDLMKCRREEDDIVTLYKQTVYAVLKC